MNNFEKQLEKWNQGVLRGAQAKLAKVLGVSTATTALWTTGKRHPSKGYIARMAELFQLDISTVSKFFAPKSTTYPEPVTPQFAGALRDQAMEEYVYNFNAEHSPKEMAELSANSVRLPFLNSIPGNYPQYDESEIIEWWSLPRRYAQGAKYIVRSQDAGLSGATDADDLCFVKPGTDVLPGKTVLLEIKRNIYKTRVLKNKDNKNGLYTSRTYPRILGTIVRRIHGI